MNPRIKPGDRVWFQWSASEWYCVTFVRWEIGRRCCGGPDTNKLGVRAVISSEWMFGRDLFTRIPRGLKRGQCRLRPFDDLFKRDPRPWRGLRGGPKPVSRPTVVQLRARQQRKRKT